jgi:hypothetical protein
MAGDAKAAIAAGRHPAAASKPAASRRAEQFAQYHVIHEDDQITTVATYRGEGQCFG